ncbi:hypothetical protein [Acaryochloris sp. IP29b_bin.148]|uniref:hypothetical protein n=1 Tax=Acaryochloris sp. IP29b_bin.148 TaxID=2969218 RepID=UPI0026091EC3|nr:hypothetical protein [Acaryochloris sp. IP29b_bin.148]
MLIHKTQIGQLSASVGCLLWLLAAPATAMPTIPSDFFAINNAAEEFFQAGHRQLEREIKLLNRRPLQDAEEILQIDEQTKLNEKELENWDRFPPQHQLQKRKN